MRHEGRREERKREEREKNHLLPRQKAQAVKRLSIGWKKSQSERKTERLKEYHRAMTGKMSGSARERTHSHSLTFTHVPPASMFASCFEKANERT